MTEIVLTGLSSQYIHMPLAPFCLKRAAEDHGIDAHITILDLNINETPEEMLCRVMALRPDVVGVSLYIWNREAAGKLIRRVKALDPGILVLVGGPEATFSPEETLREMPIDYLLRGAGEESFPRLLACLMDSGDPAEIPGVCFQRDGVLRLSPPAQAPAPRADLYDESWQRMLNGRMAYVETSRGCPFSCAFCLSGRREGVRFMPREEALALLIRVGQSGTDTVKIIDRTFNCDRERAFFLLKGLMDAKSAGAIGDVCYHLEVAADLFDDATLDLLSQAPVGLFQMEAGLQSFHAPTLDACDRHTNMARLTDRLRRILALNTVHLHIDLIAGLPEEDFETFGHSFDRAFALRPHQLQLGFLKCIHGSRLREENWGQRYSPDPPYEILSTPFMTYEELTRLRASAEAVEKIHNSGRFRRTEELMLARGGRRPFELFLLLGEAMAQRAGRWSLDALSLLVYDTALTLNLPEGEVRRAMILDRLSTDNTGFIPAFLHGDAEEERRRLRQWRTEHPQEKRARLAALPGGGVAVALWQERGRLDGSGIVRVDE